MKALQAPFEMAAQSAVFAMVSHLCTLVLLAICLWLLDKERTKRVESHVQASACLATAKQCDAELVTCIGWQARVSYELSALLDRECGL